MSNISNAAKATKAAALAVAAERSAKWTGLMVLRTISAEELGDGQDLELMYFQLDMDGRGDLLWASEDGMDELEDEDMKQYM